MIHENGPGQVQGSTDQDAARICRLLADRVNGIGDACSRIGVETDRICGCRQVFSGNGVGFPRYGDRLHGTHQPPECRQVIARRA